MAEIKAVPLGAGQDVGRSCILITMGGKNIMLDCGMHMGYQDERRFPDFSYICEDGPLDGHIDAVIISHFHLDHCGALPHMTEMVGYSGPIYMTHPTKAICPILLEDMRKIAVEKKGESNFFTSAMIKACMEKVTAVNLHQTIQVSEDFEIRAYYAGHVLGAAMFWMRVGQQTVVYTGDYNMTPDRHLGAAWIDRCRPDLLITESTYATTIRDSKRCRERDFLKKVHDCIDHGGKVLIPVFALGRAQELCILLETYWDRMNLKVPIYFTVGMTEKANHYYKLFITWTNQKIKKTFVDRNLFDFKHIKTFEKSYADVPGPAVIFATPGMLHAGQSLQIFRKLAPSEKNLLVMPGYCVHGTVGAKVIAGHKRIEMPDKHTVHVKLQVQYMSFSAHADAKGICQLLAQCEPKNVMLVHGEAIKMQFLKTKLKQEFGLDCFMPANGETVLIQTPPRIPVDVSVDLLKKQALLSAHKPEAGPLLKRPFSGALQVLQEKKMRLVDAEEALQELNVPLFHMRFTSALSWPDSDVHLSDMAEKLLNFVTTVIDGQLGSISLSADGSVITVADNVILSLEAGSNPKVLVSWSLQDEEIGSFLVQAITEEFLSEVKPDEDELQTAK